MTNEALADRIITYSDALAAFSLVNALTFVITLAEPDIRCSISVIAGPVAIGNTLVAILITWALVWLRRFERSLRPKEGDDPRVASFWRRVRWLRYALVWGVVSFVCVGLYASTLDPGCAAVLPG